jgi:hypothetical protein
MPLMAPCGFLDIAILIPDDKTAGSILRPPVDTEIAFPPP